MNRKLTTRTLRMIAIQAVLVIIAVTAVGGAVLVHGEFKATALKKDNPAGTSVTGSAETDRDKTTKTTEKLETSDCEYSYAGFNPKILKDTSDASKILINGSYCLPKGYSPSLAEAVTGSDIMLDSRVAPYYQAMYDAALNDGIKLTPISGYRSLYQQRKDLEEKIQEYLNENEDAERKEATIEAAKDVMIPGSSEHNAGIAVDICSTAESFENTREFKWLSEHAAEYGFILRYPKDKTGITKMNYQPCHFRYVGIAAAQEMNNKNICLEEYLG